MKFAFMQPNGVAAILMAAPKADIERDLGQLSDEDYRAHVMKGIPLDATNVHELPDDWKPPSTDRALRNAWVTDGKTVSIDPVKAAAITKNTPAP